MSFREVTSLRKAGRLDEALAMARADYESSIDDYSASALFWTLRLFCEKSLKDGDTSSANSFFAEMQTVYQHMSDSDGISGNYLANLEAKVSPEYSRIANFLDEAKAGNTASAFTFVAGIDSSNYPKAVKENIAWICFYHAKHSLERMSVEEFDGIVKVYAVLHAPKPSVVHSQMLNQAIRFAGLKPEYDLIGYIRNWGIKNFSDEDCTSDPAIAGGLTLKDRAIRRCFINRSVKLSDVVNLFAEDASVSSDDISALLSRSYYSILYKDSTELKDRKKYFSDADEYVSRASDVTVCNAYHSKILDSVLWEIEDNEILWFKSFFERWGVGESFMNEDWKSVTKDGKSRPSLAERAIARYADSLESSSEPYHSGYKPLLYAAVSKLGGNENMTRRLAKLCYHEGDKAESVRLMKEMIKTQGAKYYFWSDLAEYVSDNQQLCASCCAKALLLSNEEKYLGKIHLTLGKLLHDMGKDDEARYEIERYRQTNEENGWPVRQIYNDLLSQLRQDAKSPDSNLKLYRELEIQADEFAFSDVPPHNMVLVESRMEENAAGKRRLMFYLYDSQNRRYKINPNRFGLDRGTRYGSCFAVKYVDTDGKINVISVKPIPKTDVLSYKKAVVDNVNTEKKVIHIVGSGFQMVIPMNELRFRVQVCDTLDVAYTSRVKDGKTLYNRLDLRKSATKSNQIIKKTGALRLRENNNGIYGFLGNHYIGGKLLNGFADGDNIEIEGIMENGELKVLTVMPYRNEI